MLATLSLIWTFMNSGTTDFDINYVISFYEEKGSETMFFISYHISNLACWHLWFCEILVPTNFHFICQEYPKIYQQETIIYFCLNLNWNTRGLPYKKHSYNIIMVYQYVFDNYTNYHFKNMQYMVCYTDRWWDYVT